MPGFALGARFWDTFVNITEKVVTLMEVTFQWVERRQGNKCVKEVISEDEKCSGETLTGRQRGIDLIGS